MREKICRQPWSSRESTTSSMYGCGYGQRRLNSRSRSPRRGQRSQGRVSDTRREHHWVQVSPIIGFMLCCKSLNLLESLRSQSSVSTGLIRLPLCNSHQFCSRIRSRVRSSHLQCRGRSASWYVACNHLHLYLGITGGPNSSKDGVPGTQEDRRVEHLLPDHVKQHGTYECFIEISSVQ